MIRLLAVGLSLFTLICSASSAYGQSVLPLSNNDQLLSNGLYQSERYSANTVLPDGTRAIRHNQRLFLKLFPGQKVALLSSAGSAKEIDQWLTEASDMAGNDYVIINGSIIFHFGPTKHSVKLRGPGKALIRSEYANGTIDKHELTLAIPRP